MLTRGIQPNIYSIRESNGIQAMTIEYFHKNDPKLKADIERIVTEMRDAKEYGSILNITPVDFAGLYARFDEIRNDINMMQMSALDELLPLVKCAELLAQKYDVVVTNPPYLGSSRFSTKLNDFVIANYPDVKADLSMVMYKHALRDMCKKNGFVSFITTTAWMFLSSFEKLRVFVLAGYDFESLVDFGTELFEGKVGHNPIVAWVNRKSHTDHAMTGIRLVDYCYSRRDEKELEFFNKRNYHYPKQSNFSKIPGSPVAYWVGEKFVKAFENGISVDTISDFTGSQHKTADNDRFLRLFWEVEKNKIKEKAWIFYIKGGEFRKWYGNIDLVVDWTKTAIEYYNTNATSNMIKERYWFQAGITYTSLSSTANGFRYLPPIGVFDIKGPSFIKVQNMEYCLAFFNSVVAHSYFKLLNPTITLQVKDVKNVPLIIAQKELPNVSGIAKENVAISESDWDTYETSWDFKRNPLV